MVQGNGELGPVLIILCLIGSAFTITLMWMTEYSSASNFPAFFVAARGPDSQVWLKSTHGFYLYIILVALDFQPSCGLVQSLV